MKRSDKTEKSGLFGNLGQKKKPVVGEDAAPKTIRHIERPVKLPFLADMEDGKEQYGSAEDMEDKWGLNEKQATLNVRRKRTLLSLAIAFAAFIYILYLIGQITCSKEDTCDYDSNSLFLISDEDKVIEVKEKDSKNILIVLGIITIILIIGIIYKRKKA